MLFRSDIEITISYRKESENEWSEHVGFSKIGSNVADGSETGNTLNNQDVYELFAKYLTQLMSVGQ